MQRVVAPPPVIFAGAVVVGLVLQRVLPLPAPGAAAGWLAGGLLAALGLVVAGAAASRFRAAGNPFEPGRPAAALCTSGVFGLSRNPIYCGMTLICAGLALLTGAAWILVALAGAVALVHHGVILREEAMLARQFGADYLRYKERVPRWVGIARAR
jgi:protein-S-isoprenylcysteine O-methyltransferase Ste14